MHVDYTKIVKLLTIYVGVITSILAALSRIFSQFQGLNSLINSYSCLLLINSGSFYFYMVLFSRLDHTHKYYLDHLAKNVSDMSNLLTKRRWCRLHPFPFEHLSWLERVHEAGLFQDNRNQTIQWCSTNTSWAQAKATEQLWLTQK